MKKISKNNISKSFVEKAVVLLIVAIFITGVFVPAVGSQSESTACGISQADETVTLAKEESIYDITDEKATSGLDSEDDVDIDQTPTVDSDQLIDETQKDDMSQHHDMPFGGSDPLPLGRGGTWWDSHWRYSKKIAISSDLTSADLDNFPILLTIENDNDLYNHAQNDGSDIVFVDNTNTTKLSYEIEDWDSINSDVSAVIWVNITELSSTSDTVLYMYYGNPMASSQQNPAGVWDSTTKGVWHLHENCNGDGGTHVDSTMNGNDATPHGGVTTDYDGVIGGGYDFNGDNDWLEYPDNSPLAVEGWFFSHPSINPRI